ncbi:hypothetical protein Nepgr_023088 [Nepenthes gracilis]|uniref:Uncharacterized protein n=1 Tax=Nepenthes gracilis TaxID=150966 RepID=A0AAD3T3P6_NEPGR|nr:hypothetical protein Nepgr_023088 [Nepenthes gracilis]
MCHVANFRSFCCLLDVAELRCCPVRAILPLEPATKSDGWIRTAIVVIISCFMLICWDLAMVIMVVVLRPFYLLIAGIHHLVQHGRQKLLSAEATLVLLKVCCMLQPSCLLLLNSRIDGSLPPLAPECCSS